MVFGQARALLLQNIQQRAAFAELHHDSEPRGIKDIARAADVWMIDGGEDPDLAHEVLLFLVGRVLRLADELGGKDFARGLVGAADDVAERAAAQLLARGVVLCELPFAGLGEVRVPLAELLGGLGAEDDLDAVSVARGDLDVAGLWCVCGDGGVAESDEEVRDGVAAELDAHGLAVDGADAAEEGGAVDGG
eukprot:CAMPEP_0174896890 /NCGR_PEP_ID=MMETSP0167-20121228/10975_1 /TAXON_ID=38298 /ORGANISM="Rhodella maculata, Strain CCMP736" /LENGTH=191 /DNA_ID=CAMNT_0016136565 /DNA_START=605 /DNA_END=1180 /DNA_ORIENTATION=+